MFDHRSEPAPVNYFSARFIKAFEGLRLDVIQVIEHIVFEWMAIQMAAIFQAGARSIEALARQNAEIHDARQ